MTKPLNISNPPEVSIDLPNQIHMSGFNIHADLQPDQISFASSEEYSSSPQPKRQPVPRTVEQMKDQFPSISDLHNPTTDRVSEASSAFMPRECKQMM